MHTPTLFSLFTLLSLVASIPVPAPQEGNIQIDDKNDRTNVLKPTDSVITDVVDKSANIPLPEKATEEVNAAGAAKTPRPLNPEAALNPAEQPNPTDIAPSDAVKTGMAAALSAVTGSLPIGSLPLVGGGGLGKRVLNILSALPFLSSIKTTRGLVSGIPVVGGLLGPIVPLKEKRQAATDKVVLPQNVALPDNVALPENVSLPKAAPVSLPQDTPALPQDAPVAVPQELPGLDSVKSMLATVADIRGVTSKRDDYEEAEHHTYEHSEEHESGEYLKKRQLNALPVAGLLEGATGVKGALGTVMGLGGKAGGLGGLGA